MITVGAYVHQAAADHLLKTAEEATRSIIQSIIQVEIREYVAA